MLEIIKQASFFPSSFPTGTTVNHITEKNKNQSGKEGERIHGWNECSQAAVGVSCRSRSSCAPHTSALLHEGNTEVPAVSPPERKGTCSEFSQDALADNLITTSWISQSRSTGTLGALYLHSCSKTQENKSFPLQTGNKLAEICHTKHHG